MAARAGSFGDQGMLRTPIEDFKYDEDTYSIKEFIDLFRHKLPVVIKVTEGFCSPDGGIFTFSGEDTYWISHIKKQKRIIGRSSGDLNFSIPLDHKIKFMVQEFGCEPWGPSTLENIFILEDRIEEKTIHLEPTKSEMVKVWHGAESMDSMEIKRMQLIDSYEETYLVGNPVIHKHLYDHRCPIPLFVPIRVAVATGLATSKKQKAFEKEITKLKEFTQRFPNSEARGNGEIMIFTDAQVDAVGGAYEYIDPYETLGKVAMRGGYTEVVLGPKLKPLNSKPPEIPNRESVSRKDGRLPAPPPEPRKAKTLDLKSSQNITTDGLRKNQQPKKTDRAKKVEGQKGTGYPKTDVSSRLSVENDYSDAPELPPRSDSLISSPYASGDSGVCMKISEKPEGATSANQPAQNNNEQRDSDESDYEHPEIEDVYAEVGDVPKNIDFRKASKKEVGEFLRLLKLRKYIPVFYEQDIDGALLLDLDKDILKRDFNFSGIEATKLVKFVQEGWRPK